MQVMKTFHFHKLEYLFQRFRCRAHPFLRTTYDILMFHKLIHLHNIDLMSEVNQKFIRLLLLFSE